MPFDGTSQTAFQQLAETQRLLDGGRRWVQRNWADEDQRCVLAALCEVVYGHFDAIPHEDVIQAHPAFRAVIAALTKRRACTAEVLAHDLPVWNDMDGRTWDEVDELLEDAKKFALAAK